MTGADHQKYFQVAADMAKRATCYRAKCGSVIVKNDEIIGRGYNGPPRGDESQRTCDETWNYDLKPKYDKTCCIHAEWRAVLDACKTNADKIDGSTLYFMRVDDEGNFTNAGVPYCTTCSRLTLESGVEYFALWNENNTDIFRSDGYNQVSYDYYSAKAIA